MCFLLWRRILSENGKNRKKDEAITEKRRKEARKKKEGQKKGS